MGDGGTGPGGRGRPAGPDPGPGVAALVNITVPWSTVAGQSDEPGEVAGLGPLDAQDVRSATDREDVPIGFALG